VTNATYQLSRLAVNVEGISRDGGIVGSSVVASIPTRRCRIMVEVALAVVGNVEEVAQV
jgi:hypothetical protein